MVVPAQVYEPYMHPAELIEFILGLISFAVMIATVLYCVKHKDYPPIKGKQVNLLALSTLGGFCWWFSMKFFLRGLLTPTSSASCQIWGVWVAIVFGVYLWIVVLNYRLYIIFKTLVSVTSITAKFRSDRMVVVFFVLWSPALLLGIIYAIFDLYPAVSDVDADGVVRNHCSITPAGTGMFVGFVIFYILMFCYFIYVERNVRASFNEYYQTRQFCGWFVACVIFYSVSRLKELTSYWWGRLILSLLVLVIINYYFWAVIFDPLYGYIFDRERCLENFRRGMQMDSSEKRSTRSYSSSRKDNLDVSEGAEATYHISA